MIRKRYIRTLLFLLTAIVLSLLTSSCSLKRELPTRQYFIINYTPESVAPEESMRPYPYALEIGRFEVQRIFNRQNIIYRYSPNRIQYYELERWAVRPDYMIRDMIFKHFAAVRLTNNIGIDFLDTRPDYRIEGSVEALEKYDAGDLFYAHLAMSFKMIDVTSGLQVWDYSFDERKRVYSDEMVHTVAGMSAILQSHMTRIVDEVDALYYLKGGGEQADWPLQTPAMTPAPADSTDDGIDDSAFEIIPEG